MPAAWASLLTETGEGWTKERKDRDRRTSSTMPRICRSPWERPITLGPESGILIGRRGRRKHIDSLSSFLW
jgi:hypothetical protein